MSQKVAVSFCHRFHVRGSCGEVTMFIKIQLFKIFKARPDVTKSSWYWVTGGSNDGWHAKLIHTK